MNKDRRFRATPSRSRVLAPVIVAVLAGLSSASFAQDDDFEALFGPEPAEDQRAESEPATENDNTDAQADQQDQASDQAAAAQSEEASDSGSDEPAGRLAEPPPEQSVAAAPSSRLIEEIVVTAQKREEDLQEVPIMINAFSGEKLDAFGIESTADLQKVTPGLTYTYTYGYSVIYIRGVGTDAFLPNADPSVATYIDGVNIGPSQGKQDTLGPVERVEVLKGPQGTLFGRNATGGAINIITADPPEQFESTLKAEFGNFNSRKYQVYLASPLTNFAGATLALFKEDQNLFGRNEIFGMRGEERPDFVEGGRLKLKAFATDNLSFTFSGTINNQFNSNSLSQENTRPAPLYTGGVPADEPDRVWHNDYLGGNLTDNELYALTGEWLTPWLDLKAIYSDNFADVVEASYDYDSTENAQAFFYSNEQFNDQQTFELQFLSNNSTPLSKHLQWVAGYYKLEGEGGFTSLYLGLNGLSFFNNASGVPALLNNLGAAAGAAGLGDIVSQIANATNDIVLGNGGILLTDSESIYFQATWFATDWLDLTVGARFQTEVRGITNSYLDIVDPTVGKPDAGENGNPYFDSRDRSRNIRVQNFSAPDLEDETVSPRVAIQWRLSDRVQIFASGQRGYKSPTYNIVNFFTDPDPVERETATAFELGFKSELFNNSLRLNAAVFQTDIEGLLTAIVSTGSGGVVTFRNAGEAEISGAEFDALWQPMPNVNPGLAINLAATYLDAKYTNYPNGAGFDDETGLYFGDDSLVGDTSRDFSGNDIVRTPDVTASVSINQFLPLNGRGDLELGLDYYYNSGYNTTPQNSPLYEQPAFGLWSTRLSYFYNPWDLQLTAFVENATDEQYFQAILQQDFGRTVTLAPPRTFGLRVKWNYGR